MLLEFFRTLLSRAEVFPRPICNPAPCHVLRGVEILLLDNGQNTLHDSAGIAGMDSHIPAELRDSFAHASNAYAQHNWHLPGSCSKDLGRHTPTLVRNGEGHLVRISSNLNFGY